MLSFRFDSLSQMVIAFTFKLPINATFWVLPFTFTNLCSNLYFIFFSGFRISIFCYGLATYFTFSSLKIPSFWSVRLTWYLYFRLYLNSYLGFKSIMFLWGGICFLLIIRFLGFGFRPMFTIFTFFFYTICNFSLFFGSHMCFHFINLCILFPFWRNYFAYLVALCVVWFILWQWLLFCVVCIV